MDWTLLEIEPTKDKNAITAAYRAKVVTVNPEDKPEEFKALRAAYEEALALAARKEQPVVEDTSPLGQWAGKIRALYDDYAARCDPENWRALLREDVCISLDSRPLAEEKLLAFLLEDYSLPRPVWLVLEENFDWTRRIGELYERYPRDFVDYVILNGIRLESSLPFALFTPGRNGQDCDEYRRLYHRAANDSGDEQEDLLRRMEQLSESHPYGLALRYQRMVAQGRLEEGRAGLEALCQQYPDDPRMAMVWGNECINMERWEQAEALMRRVSRGPDTRYHIPAKRALAQCLKHLDRCEEAKDLLFDLMRDAGGDQKEVYYLNQMVDEVNRILIPKYEKIIAEDMHEQDIALKLGWCYLQSDNFDKAESIRNFLVPHCHTPYDYHLYCSKVFYARQKWEESLQELYILDELLLALPADCRGDDLKHLKRRSEFFQTQGACLISLERPDEALEKYEQAVELAPNNAEVITRTIHLYYNRRMYDKALALVHRLTDLMPLSYHGYFLTAQILYDMQRDQDAFQAVNRALDLERTDLAVYVLKMRILLRNGVFDEVRSILDFLAANGVDGEITMDWCYAQLTELEEKDLPRAMEQYQALAARMEQGETLPWGAQVYLRLTILTAENKDARDPGDWEELMALLDKGLAIDENDFDCLDYKAWLLKRHGKRQEALDIYHALEKRPHNLRIEQELAELYYQDLDHDAETALHYFELLLQRDPSAANLFYAATCCRCLRQWSKGEALFLRMQELYPDDTDGYRGLALLYEMAGEPNKALEQHEKRFRVPSANNTAPGYSQRLRCIKLLRRAGRWQEAVAEAKAVKNEHDFNDYDETLVDIYFQFGRWAEAAAHLKEWKRVNRQVSLRITKEIRLKVLTGDLLGAKLHFALHRKKLSGIHREDMEEMFSALEGDVKKQFELWGKRVEKDPSSTHALMNLAEQYWWDGRHDQARLYAQRALPLLDKLIEDNPLWEALYRGRRSMVLAILGREAEAREDLKKVRQAPLCESCTYGACKDADAFEAFIEEVLGHDDAAGALYRRGMAQWPDEVDFIAGAKRIKRKDT